MSEPGILLSEGNSRPFFFTKQTKLLTSYHQEHSGSPKFLCASLHTCHALMTPAVPPESRHNDSLVQASVTLTTWPTASMLVTTLYHASGVRLTPCGLHDSLCTLYAGRSTVCLSLPHTTLNTDGWLNLIRQGLTPCKKNQALLGALTISSPEQGRVMTAAYHKARRPCVRWSTGVVLNM